VCEILKLLWEGGLKIEGSETSHAGPNLPVWEARQEARSMRWEMKNVTLGTVKIFALLRC